MIKEGKYKNKPHTEILNEIYRKALDMVNEENLQLSLNQLNDFEKSTTQIIVDNFERGKGVLTVLITSLIHKLHNPEQDIRLHQDNMDGGYSGRGVDTKYVTPFMKEMEFPSMAESGWLTRSLEQNLSYDLNYPGKITPPELKAAFLNPISTIINYLKQHFESRYSARGASRLPTLAIYAIYQCMIKELKRFEGKVLMPLEEHTSSDKSSGRVGDVEVRDSKGRVFEAVEIKYGIQINSQLVKDAYEKFKSHPIQRYYLLSTADVDSSDIENLTKEVSRILKIHGCQVIINGIYPSLKYYLRLLHNTYDFIDNYVENLKKDKTIKYEHKLKWNEIVSRQVSKSDNE